MQKKLISLIGLLLILNLSSKVEAQLVVAPSQYISGGGSAQGPIIISDGAGGTVGSGTALTIEWPAPIELHSGFAAGITEYTHSNTSFRAPVLALNRSHGTEAIPTVISSGDTLGYLQVGGYNSGSVGYLNGFSCTFKGWGDWTVAGTKTGTADCGVGGDETAFRIGLISAATNHIGFGVGADSTAQIHYSGISWGDALYATNTLPSSDVTDLGSPKVYSFTASGSGFQGGVGFGGANATGPVFTGLKTRSTTDDANTIVVSGDAVVNLQGLGADGAAYRSAGTIQLAVDGTPGSSDMPGRWDFYTTPDGSATPLLRFSMPNDGGLRGSEITAPAAPVADKGTIFFQDNGSGKTQACAKFNTGAVQCFATQP